VLEELQGFACRGQGRLHARVLVPRRLPRMAQFRHEVRCRGRAVYKANQGGTP
jgi:hypothetical protein